MSKLINHIKQNAFAPNGYQLYDYLVKEFINSLKNFLVNRSRVKEVDKTNDYYTKYFWDSLSECIKDFSSNDDEIYVHLSRWYGEGIVSSKVNKSATIFYKKNNKSLASFTIEFSPRFNKYYISTKSDRFNTSSDWGSFHCKPERYTDKIWSDIEWICDELEISFNDAPIS